MAYYNMNEIIRLTRIAKDISQEELCYEICTTSTLSGIENGKIKIRVKFYKKLMERMKRLHEVLYAVCITKEGGILDYKEELEQAFKRYDYAMAEEYVSKMKMQADSNALTMQYLARAEAILDYYQNRISAEEWIQRLDYAMRLTVPEYQEYIGRKEKNFPFFKEELLVLMSLGEAYRQIGDCEKSVQYIETMLACLDMDYMGNPDRVNMQITGRRNLALIYEQQRKNEEALQEINACLQMVRERNYGHILSVLLTGKAHNMIKLVKRSGWDESHLEEAKETLRQAYIVATARREDDVAKTIKHYYIKNFGAFEDFRYV